ncbi:MAG: S-layer homology domain-containing protein [Candidatus Margulisiibacteriota bacterium]
MVVRTYRVGIWDFACPGLPVVIGIFCLLFFQSAVFAATEFRDLPKSSTHYATDSVYRVVQMGVTQGFPDGTFRGDKLVTRNEMASFLSKFHDAVSGLSAEDEKLLAELRWELARTNDDFQEYKRTQGSFAQGFVDLGFRFAPAFLSGRSKAESMFYRIKYAFKKNFGEDARLFVNFDTNDAGYNSTATREIFTTMVDVKGQYQWGDTLYTLAVGPGPILHTDSGIDPSENNQVYVRPRPKLSAAGKLGAVDSEVAYIAHDFQTSGRIGFSELQAAFSWKETTAAARYYFTGINSSRAEDYHLYGTLDSVLQLSKKLEGRLFVGYTGASSFGNGLGLGISGKIKDYFNTGTTVDFSYSKIGNSYRTGLSTLETYELAGLNYFDRMILDNQVDVGVKVTQKINAAMKIYGKLDAQLTADNQFGVEYPGTNLTEELALEYAFIQPIAVNCFYRVFLVPSGVDQLGTTAAAQSDVVGIKVSSRF